MPRTSKGSRLIRRPNGIYYIRDGAHRQSTGTRDRRTADQELSRYIRERARPTGPTTPDQMTVAACLDHYGSERAPHVASPARIGHAIAALTPHLGHLPVSAITGETCRRYWADRGTSQGTVRRELGVLRAAINHCHAEGYLTAAPKVRLPAKPAPRDRWLTRDEVARLIRAARRTAKGRHLARFILTAVYTGTRKDALLRIQFMPSTTGGWVDLERGVLYRRASGKSETKKRTPPIPVPPRLLGHMRRWKANGARFVVEIGGQRVGDIKTAWKAALAESGIEHCTPHDLRRTAVTWAMQRGIDKWAACGFFGLTMDVLESTYGHHHPDHLRSAVEAMERRA